MFINKILCEFDFTEAIKKLNSFENSGVFNKLLWLDSLKKEIYRTFGESPDWKTWDDWGWYYKKGYSAKEALKESHRKG